MLNNLFYSVTPKVLIAIFPFIQIHLIGVNSVGDTITVITSVSFILVGVLSALCNDIILRDLVKLKVENESASFHELAYTLLCMAIASALLGAVVNTVLVSAVLKYQALVSLNIKQVVWLIFWYSINVSVTIVSNFGRVYVVAVRGVRSANNVLLIQGVLANGVMLLSYTKFNVLAPALGLIISNAVSLLCFLKIMVGDGIFRQKLDSHVVHRYLTSVQVRTLVCGHCVMLLVTPIIELIATSLGPGLGVAYSWCTKAIQIPQGLILGPLLENISVGMMRLQFSGKISLTEMSTRMIHIINYVSTPLAVLAYIGFCMAFTVLEGFKMVPETLSRSAEIVVPILLLTLPASIVTGFNSRLISIKQELGYITAIGLLSQLGIIILSFVVPRYLGIAGLAVSRVLFETFLLVPSGFMVLRYIGCYNNSKELSVQFLKSAASVVLIIIVLDFVNKTILSLPVFLDYVLLKLIVQICALFAVAWIVWRRVKRVLSDGVIRSLLRQA